LVQGVLGNYKNSLNSEDSKQLSKIAEDSMAQQIVGNARGEVTEEDARQIIHNAEASMTDDEAEQIIKNAAATMSVDDAQNLVNNADRLVQEREARDFVLKLEKETKIAEQLQTSNDVKSSIDDATLKGDGTKQITSHAAGKAIVDEMENLEHDHEKKTDVMARVQTEPEAQQIIDDFNKALSKEESQELLAKAEEKMTQRIVDDAKGALSESEARDVVYKAEKSMTDKDARQIIDRAEESMSVDDARQFVNSEKEAILDARIARASKATAKTSSLAKGDVSAEARNVKGAPSESKTHHILRNVEESILDKAQGVFREAKSAEKSFVDKAQGVIHKAKKAEESFISKARRAIRKAKKAVGMDDAQKVTHVAPPTPIINHASDMMKVADYEITKPTSPELKYLSSPFGFN